MRKVLIACSVLGLVFSFSGQAQAFTETGDKDVITTSAGGDLAASTTFIADQVVIQGTADTAASLGWGTVTNQFEDSDEAIKITVDTNLAANRIIIYTNNLSAEADPQACINTGLGNDGGGLVGVTDCSRTVPLLWVVKDTNVDHSFTTGTVGDDEIYFTDRAHVVSYTTVDSTLDNQAMYRCDDDTPVTNTASDGLYPQFFGVGGGTDSDLCDGVGSTTVVSQELSKNIAVVGFGFAGTVGRVPDLSTSASDDNVEMTSPIYLPIGADFSSAVAQSYSTNTISLELVTQ